MEVTLVGTLKLNTTQQFKRDDATTWTEKNPVLLEGEPGLELDTGKIKIGDGVSNWNAIPYFMGDKLDNKANVELTNVTNQAFKSKADSAGVGKEKIISATYAELQKLVNEQSLIPGQKYLLSDYRTVYQQPITNVIKTSAPEQLLLTALDTAHFAPECNSLNYPQDIVTYDFNMNICEDDTTPRNGFITWRKSTNTTGSFAQLSAPQDWRTMLWVRYKPDPDYYMRGTTKTPYEIWSSGKAVVKGKLYKAGNYILYAIVSGIPSGVNDKLKWFDICNVNEAFLLTDTTICRVDNQAISIIKSNQLLERKTFQSSCYFITVSGRDDTLHNNIFDSYSNSINLGSGCLNNTFGYGAFGNVLNVACHNNIFGRFTCYNLLYGGCSNNFFGELSYGNELHYGCDKNAFHYCCSYNTLDYGCSRNYFMFNTERNKLGKYCTNNLIQAMSTDNKFGNYCGTNTLENYVKSNVIGESCSNNIFGSSCDFNTIYSNVQNNQFGSYMRYNTIFSGCVANTFGSSHYNLTVKQLQNKNISNISALTSGSKPYTIEQSQSGNYYYWCLNSSGQMQSTLIP